jgi:hypothetical protein
MNRRTRQRAGGVSSINGFERPDVGGTGRELSEVALGAAPAAPLAIRAIGAIQRKARQLRIEAPRSPVAMMDASTPLRVAATLDAPFRSVST